MKSKVVSIIFLLLFSLAKTIAQPTLSTTSKKAIALYTEADNFRVRGEFDKAIDLLTLALAKDENFEEAYFRLGVTYKNKEDISLSTKNFERGFTLVKDPKRRRDYLYELGQNYLKLGKYEESLLKTELFVKQEQLSKPRIDQATIWKVQAEYAIIHKNEKLEYINTPLNDSVNSFPNQYFPALTADGSQLFFTVRYGSGTNENEDIVVSKKDGDGTWQKPISVSEKINSKLQEGACSVSADGHQLIFTMCGGVTYGRCDLFESKKIGGEWSRPANLGPLVNSTEWEGQPSLSADGRVLYFSSSRKGGVGGYDLWVTKKDESGKWTKAQNVGNSINTKFDEISPFIHVNNQTLYFASNGYPGFGGYDVYQTDRSKVGWTAPANLGAPLNDFEDQFSFFVTADGTMAYFSKADVANRGLSKIYQTVIPQNKQIARKSSFVKGVVRDNESGKPFKAKIELSSQSDNEKTAIVESDSVDGSYLFVLNRGSSYSLFVSAPNYLFQTYSFEIDSTKEVSTTILDIDLKPIRPRAASVLNNIFFDLNKAEIKPNSFSELESAVRFLKINPAMVIEVGGHTDTAGSEDYNLKLSLKRSQSVIDYLIQKGIEKSRVVSKGYGSSKPRASNDSESNRQLNRRIEFVILK